MRKPERSFAFLQQATELRAQALADNITPATALLTWQQALQAALSAYISAKGRNYARFAVITSVIQTDLVTPGRVPADFLRFYQTFRVVNSVPGAEHFLRDHNLSEVADLVLSVLDVLCGLTYELGSRREV